MDAAKEPRQEVTEIWAISTGEYSDYRVCAVTPDQDTARAWVAALCAAGGDAGEYRMEKLAFIPAGLAPYKTHCVTLCQEWWDSGVAEDEPRIHEADAYPVSGYAALDAYPERPCARFVRAPVHRDRGGRIEIRGRDLKSVMKVYSEQRAMWLAAPAAYGRGVE